MNRRMEHLTGIDYESVWHNLSQQVTTTCESTSETSRISIVKQEGWAAVPLNKSGMVGVKNDVIDSLVDYTFNSASKAFYVLWIRPVTGEEIAYKGAVDSSFIRSVNSIVEITICDFALFPDTVDWIYLAGVEGVDVLIGSQDFFKQVLQKDIESAFTTFERTKNESLFVDSDSLLHSLKEYNNAEPGTTALIGGRFIGA